MTTSCRLVDDAVKRISERDDQFHRQVSCEITLHVTGGILWVSSTFKYHRLETERLGVRALEMYGANLDTVSITEQELLLVPDRCFCGQINDTSFDSVDMHRASMALLLADSSSSSSATSNSTFLPGCFFNLLVIGFGLWNKTNYD